MTDIKCLGCGRIKKTNQDHPSHPVKCGKCGSSSSKRVNHTGAAATRP